MTRRVDHVEEYRNALRDLTFNSKPIINNLTIYLQENRHSASALTKVLLDHFVACDVDYKLPTLYLIDSICKNIGEPYISLFTSALPTILPQVFRQITDERVKRDFSRTFETWWNVFPTELVKEIQRKSSGEQRSHLGPRKAEDVPPPRQRPPQPIPASMAGSFGHAYPAPPPIPPHVERMLKDLKASVTVPPAMYNEGLVTEIMYHLEYSADPAIFRGADERARLVDKRPLIEFIDTLLLNSAAPVATNIPGIQTQRAPIVSPPIQQLQQPKAKVTTPPLPVDVSPLLASLSSLPLNLGSLANLKLPTLPISTASIKLTYEDITKSLLSLLSHDFRARPTAYRAIYEDFPRQCTNCALRFPDTVEGKANLEAHLDAHFRRNIRLKDKAKKVMSRVWMQPEEDWIRNIEAQESEQQAALFTATTADKKESKQDEKNLPKVSAGSDHEEKICSICHDKMVIVWDDERDEWVYKDAVIDKNNNAKITHASCSHQF